MSSDGEASDDDSSGISSLAEDSTLPDDASEDVSSGPILPSSVGQSHPVETASISNKLDDPLSLSSSLNPPTVKERMEAAGIVFNETESVRGFPEDETCAYYVVNLIWEAHPISRA